MTRELLDRRVLGAVAFLDAATRARVLEPLAVRAEGARLARTRRGLYVVFDAPGLKAHTRAFDAPPSEPARGSAPVTLEVSDPAGRYVARRYTLRLPLDPDPANTNLPGSLFNPSEVTLFPSPSAGTRPGWALVRATVVAADGGGPLGGALLRVKRLPEGTLIARGMSDARGEALVVVPGIPLVTFGDGDEVTEKTISVSLRAVYDPEAGEVADPDDLEARRGALPSHSFDRSLSSGRVLAATFAVPLP
jgi:hypothetical protein